MDGSDGRRSVAMDDGMTAEVVMDDDTGTERRDIPLGQVWNFSHLLDLADPEVQRQRTGVTYVERR
jgi:hypothetical protein